MTNNTSLCYIEKDGCYLMLHRTKKKNDANGGKWIGVGGHFEHGESPEDCVKREVFEETGFTLTSCRFRGIITFSYDDDPAEYMFLFTSDSFTGEMHECDEGDLRWIPKDGLDSIPMWQGDRLFLTYIEKDEPFFSLKLIYRNDKLAGHCLNGGDFIPYRKETL